jgi:hypothetical protein
MKMNGRDDRRGVSPNSLIISARKPLPTGRWMRADGVVWQQPISATIDQASCRRASLKATPQRSAPAQRPGGKSPPRAESEVTLRERAGLRRRARVVPHRRMLSACQSSRLAPPTTHRGVSVGSPVKRARVACPVLNDIHLPKGEIHAIFFPSGRRVRARVLGCDECPEICV